MNRVLHGDILLDVKELSFQEPGQVDDSADADDDNEILENPDVHIFRSRLSSVCKWFAHSRVSKKFHHNNHIDKVALKPFKCNKNNNIDGAA